ncbi:MAG TPA: arylsulfatase, partial [Armatimonadaceae bacterium]|nr:arylsulfatase [Armatimonadaceae bacterium]
MLENHPGSRRRPPVSPLSAAACLVLSVAALTPARPAAAQGLPPAAVQRPNIVLIYADDLGYGDVSCYGARAVRTPNVDRLAKEGLRFTNGYAPSATCTPSRYAMLTGEYAFRKPGTGVLPGDAALIIEPGRTTLATTLRDAGYATGVVGKWHIGLGSGEIDWNRPIAPGPREVGFDYSFIMAATGDRVPTVYVENHRVVGLDPKDPITVRYGDAPFPGEPTGKQNPGLLKVKPSHGHDQAVVNGISRIGHMKGGKAARWVDEDIADTLTKRATDFIERQGGASRGGSPSKPFFLYFSLHDIHVPRAPHPRFVGRTGMGPRGDAIAQMDWCVGEVLGALDRKGLTARTLVLFTSDNGPVVDDGYRDQAVAKLGDHKPAGPLRGGKYSLFEGGTRVPLIVRWPGTVNPGVSHELVSQVDFPASLAALAGPDRLRPSDSPDSFDLLPALLGRSGAKGREYVVEHVGPRAAALRQGDWKYIPPTPG